MARVCMSTLTDVRNDLRIRKEAESLARRHEMSIVSNIPALPPGPFAYRGMTVINIRLWTRKLPKSPIFWLVKYIEFLLRATLAGVGQKAAVYHGHDITGAVPAMCAAKLRRATFIYDAHELEADRTGTLQRSWWAGRLLLASVRFVLRRADHVICASALRAEIMLNEYGVRSLPTPIMNVTPRDGLPVEADVCDEIRNRDFTGKRIVLYQGTLVKERGIDRVVAALNHLPDDVVLLVLGGGGMFDQLIEQAKRDGTAERLVMVGRVPADSLVAYMKLADVGLAIYQNNCRNNYYCAPNKVYEYASVGLPIVGPNFPEVQQVVDTYKIGQTFDPEDETSIAAAIRNVLSDPATYQTMSQAARTLKDTVNWESQEDRLHAIYNDLLQ